MTRVIKFRFWDVQNERMVYEPYWFKEATWPEDKKNADHVFYEHWQDVDDGISRSGHLMQFTGFHDKENTEIYQDDIISLRADGKPTAIIIWGFAGWEFKWIDETFKRVRQTTSEPVFKNIALFKIIGNIYQNPELIKE